MSDTQYTAIPPDAPISPEELRSIRALANTSNTHFSNKVALALLDEIDRLNRVIEQEAEMDDVDLRPVGELFPDWTLDEEHAQ